MTRIAPYVIAASALALSACTNPYDPVQRGLGAGILGAASGAAIGAAAGGGPEPRSERRSAGQPGFLEESQVHLRRHRALITATQPMHIPVTVIQATRSRATDTQAPRDTPPTPVLRTMDIRATRSPAMDIRATRETPLTPVLRAMDTKATQDSPPSPLRVTDRQATRGTPTPDPRPLRRQATGTARLPRCSGLWISEPPPILPTPVPVTEILALAIPAIALGGLVAWGRVRDRAPAS